MPEKKNKLNNTKIKNPEKFSEDFNNLKNITFSILGKMKDTAETRTLKEKLQKCDDIVELVEITTKILERYKEQVVEHITSRVIEIPKEECQEWSGWQKSTKEAKK